MSEDDDISNLASRMSHSPHFSSMGRRGHPMRERPGSGGSGVDEDGVDGPNIDRGFLNTNSPNAVRIPIRIEAEAPPGCMPVQPQEEQQHHEHKQEQLQQQGPVLSEGPQPSMNHLNKQPQFASKTTPSIDTMDKDNSRNTRCSSAPPDMKDPSQGQRFVSKASITPRVVGDDKSFNSNQDFNNVAKPFVSSYQPQNTAPIPEETSSLSSQDQNKEGNDQHQMPQQPYQEMQFPNQSYQQQYQHPQQSFQQEPYRDSSDYRSGIVRNIPIIIEGRNQKVSSNKDNTPPGRSPPQMQQPSRPPHWNRPVDDPHFGFGPSHDFPSQDDFFKFSGMPHQQQQSYSYEQPNQHTQPGFQQPQNVFTQQPNYQPTQKTPYQQDESENQFQQREKTPEPPKDIKMETISAVRASVTELQEKVDKFEDKEKNKEFLYIDEMLTRALLQLDNIDPDGRDDVRQARRNLIKDINNTISKLEKKATQTSDETKTENIQMEVDSKAQPENVTPSVEETSQDDAKMAEGNTGNTDVLTDVPKEINTGETNIDSVASTETSAVDGISKTEPSAEAEAQEVISATSEKMETEISTKPEENPSSTVEKSEVQTTDSSQPQA